MKNKPTVLIVGAGVTGLVLALWLAKAGLRPRIVDRRSKPDRRSKALSIAQATLRTFSHLEVLRPMLADGAFNDTIILQYRKRVLSEIRLHQLDPEFPGFLMLPQPQTEAHLTQALADRGIHVEYDHEVVSVRETKSRVDATFRKGETASVDYLVACDGGRSAIRTHLKIPFLGRKWPAHFLMCDATVDWPGASGWRYIATREGFAVVIPMARDQYRVVVSAPGAFDRSISASSDMISGRLEAMGFTVGLHESTWSSAAPLYCRLASTFVDGRVLLAGDAAHLFSPIGGQGMNTGVQDATVAARAILAAFDAGDHTAPFTQYAASRRRVAERILTTTSWLTDAIMFHGSAPSQFITAQIAGELRIGTTGESLPQFLAGLGRCESVDGFSS